VSDRDLQSILAEALGQLGPPGELPSRISSFSILQPDTQHSDVEDGLSCTQPECGPTRISGAINYIGNGKNGNYGNSSWAVVVRLFPYLERCRDPKLFDYLDPGRPPSDIPASRWARYIEDARAFLSSDWFEQARSLGWTIEDLFGADDAKPYARLDRAGLVLLLNGDQMVKLTSDAAAIATSMGARLVYRRRKPNPNTSNLDKRSSC